MNAKVAITTAKRINEKQLKQVKILMGQFRLPFLARDKRSIKTLFAQHDLTYLFVVESNQIYLTDGQDRFFWHPNTALLKLKERVGGPLIEALAVRPTDSVLDCTMGLATDALVIANFLSEGGSVTALESNAYIAYLTQHGITSAPYQIIRQLASRITIINCDYRDYLPDLAPNSVDVIYFDPMFKQTNKASTGICGLRKLANKAVITRAIIEMAGRVARRRIVVKERFASGVLRTLKPDHIVGERRKGRVVYGVFDTSD